MCALISTGCQLLTVADVENPQTPSAPKPTDLERLLAAGHWEADPTWSVLAMTARLDGSASIQEPWRWKFVVPDPPKETTKETTQAPSPASELPSDLPELRTRYAWLWEPSPDIGPDQLERREKLVEELKAVAGKPGSTGLTATILLARCSPNSPEQWDSLFAKLPPTDDPAIKPGTYAAAAETLCRVSATPVGDPEVNFAPAGRWLENSQVSEPVRCELFRGIARRIPPRRIPGLGDVIAKKGSAQVAAPLEIAAVEACVLHAWTVHREDQLPRFEAEDWPEGLWSSRFAKDSTLRKLFGRWAALAGHPDALAVLKAQRLDFDLGVREDAVISLGRLTGDGARDELLAVMSDGTDPEREAAIACLARGGVEAVLKFAQDESPRLRAAAARELGRFPTRAAAVTLAELLSDRSAKVQLAALDACAQPAWKEHGRAPLLLHALRDGTLETQMAALEQLRSEWGQEPMFPLNGTFEERDAAVRKLAADHQVSTEVFTAFSETDAPGSSSDAADVRRDQVRRLLRMSLQPAAGDPGNAASDDVLETLDAAAAPLIEQELEGAAGQQAEAIYRDVLPKLHPGYAALLRLESTDPVKRRQGAREIRHAAEKASLSPTFLRRLAQRMVAEQDRQVWQDVSAALLPDALPEAAQIALIALNSPWPDIRHFGCAYFERHPQPEYAAWLLPRLEDADRQLRLRAIRILARCGNPMVLGGLQAPSEAPGLRTLLTETDQEIRWEAVLAMSALGDPQAAQELIRQSYDPHPRQRELAVAAMAQTGQTRFIEHLLRRAWTENDRAVQAAMLKALDQLAPMDDRPGLAPESSIGDKITQWARWWETRQQKSSAPPVTEPIRPQR